MANKSGITFGIKLTFQRRNCPTLAICFPIARRTVAAEGFFSKTPSFCPILWPDFDYSYRGTVPVTLYHQNVPVNSTKPKPCRFRKVASGFVVQQSWRRSSSRPAAHCPSLLPYSLTHLPAVSRFSLFC